MCGICGIYNLRGKKKIEEGVLDKMLYAIRHRGPDGSQRVGDFVVFCLGLGKGGEKVQQLGLIFNGHPRPCGENFIEQGFREG